MVGLSGSALHARFRRGRGENIHPEGLPYSLVDYNRAGAPLLEIVTEPDIENGEEARVFLTEIRNIIRYLGASSCDMEKGTMRVEPNISVRKPGETTLPKYKVEVKISIPSSLPKRLLTMRFIVKLKY